MISCSECRERLYPDDPGVRVGRYNLSSCEHYCNKPQYYRNLEQMEHTQVIEYRHYDMSAKDYARLQNLEGQVKYLQGKLTERTRHKRTTKPTAYKGIK